MIDEKWAADHAMEIVARMYTPPLRYDVVARVAGVEVLVIHCKTCGRLRAHVQGEALYDLFAHVADCRHAREVRGG